MSEQNSDLPEWLILQIASNSLVYFVCLLVLGVNFWKASAITVIVILSLLFDFCRKYVAAVGGVLLTIALLGWVGIDLSPWLARINSLPSP